MSLFSSPNSSSSRIRRMLTVGASVGAAGIMAVALTGCGDKAKDDGAGASDDIRTQGIAYAQCMRQHGVANFPDPDSTGKVAINKDTIGADDATLEAAGTACKDLTPTAPSGDKSSSNTSNNKRLNAALKHAACMREHGITNFPDPKLASDGGLQMDMPRGVDPDSATYQDADKACQSLMNEFDDNVGKQSGSK